MKKRRLRVESEAGDEVLTSAKLEKICIDSYTDFGEKYLVYRMLRDSGFVVAPGIKFGSDFAVYQHGPGLDHAPVSRPGGEGGEQHNGDGHGAVGAAGHHRAEAVHHRRGERQAREGGLFGVRLVARLTGHIVRGGTDLPVCLPALHRRTRHHGATTGGGNPLLHRGWRSTRRLAGYTDWMRATDRLGDFMPPVASHRRFFLSRPTAPLVTGASPDRTFSPCLHQPDRRDAPPARH